MPRKPRFTLGLALLCGLCWAWSAIAQTAPTGVITGRLTIKGEPAPHITVLLLKGEQFTRTETIIQTTTDADGRYRLEGLAAGNYNIQPRAPAYIVSGESNFFGNQKTVRLDGGETVNEVDFTLVRGGVITGRVTDAEGKPLISEQIKLNVADEKSYGSLGALQFRFATDDRGIYRLYGVPPGRYVVSAGQEPQGFSMSGRQFYRPQTFHPDATARAEAKVIEITEGSEAKGVDIVLATQKPSFQVTGRVIDAVTGEPVAGAIISYGRVEQGHFAGYGSNNRPTNAQGRFVLEAVTPGEYGAFLHNYREPDSNYSEVTKFTVADQEVNEVEIKAQRGSAVTGMITLEGTDAPALLTRLRALPFYVSQPNEDNKRLSASLGRSFKVAPNGSFRVIGLRPGAVSFQIAFPRSGFKLARIEQNGVAVSPDNLIVKAGADLNDVRLVFEHHAGRLVGQLTYTNGVLGENDRIFISLRGAGSDSKGYWSAFPDVRGRFVIEGLKTGTYKISISLSNSQNGRDLLQQEVFITAEGETRTDFTIDLSKNNWTGGRL